MKTTIKKGSMPWAKEGSDEYKLWHQLRLLKSTIIQWEEIMQEVADCETAFGVTYKVTADIEDVQAMLKYVTKQYERFNKVVRW